MENQRETKEKIIEILKSHSYHHTEGVGVKSQFKYLAEVAFECCADEIMLALDQSQFTADEAEEHINSEVEKRIAERMVKKDEISKRQKDRGDYLREMGYPMQVIVKYQDAILETWEWLRSRLTKPGADGSQKTEGGGE